MGDVSTHGKSPRSQARCSREPGLSGHFWWGVPFIAWSHLACGHSRSEVQKFPSAEAGHFLSTKESRHLANIGMPSASREVAFIYAFTGELVYKYKYDWQIRTPSYIHFIMHRIAEGELRAEEDCKFS